jgi:peptide/nickel transport system substrate-binding protein
MSFSGFRAGKFAAIALLALLPMIGSASAQALRIALSGAVTAVDPHFHNLGPNNEIAEHIFEKLTHFDKDGKLVPGLAESWSREGDNVWIFRLRKGVTFQDGSEFGANDVIASLDRAGNVPNSPGPFTTYLSSIKAVSAIDDQTVRIETKTANALLPFDLATIYIVEAKAAKASTEDFNTGRSAIGTGPFKLVSYDRSGIIELARNDTYWGPKPHWAKVTLRSITNGAARVAALLAGDADVIEGVLPSDVERLLADKAVAVYSSPSTRLLYLTLDQDRDQSPYIAEPNGAKLEQNPLKDARVRKALSIGIDRNAIVAKILNNYAAATGQLVPEGVFGHVADIKPPAYNPDEARKLLSEAGYPQGFSLTVHGSSDRYVNGQQVLAAIAAYWTRIGVQTSVEVMPFATLASKVRDRAFTSILTGFAAVTGNGAAQLQALVATYDPEKKSGALNRISRYSNPKVDEAIALSYAAGTEEQRLAAIRTATETALVEEVGLIPLYHQVTIWGARADFKVTPRRDEYTLASEVVPNKH